MKLFVSVPAPDADGTLIKNAVAAWDDFKTNIRHPITAEHPQFSDTWLAAGGRAGVSVDHAKNRAHIILESELLNEGSDIDKRLTLLHESIHTDFAFGEHKERWKKREERCEASVAEIRRMESDSEPPEAIAFVKRRDYNALTAIQLPDEIVAEQKLKRDYPELFEARARYYVRMRQRHEGEIATPRADDLFWPLRVFHELLRTSFFIPLVEHIPEPHAELERLAQNAEARLRECSPPELCEFLLALKSRLLNVSQDAPLTEAEGAYEELYDRIMAIEAPEEKEPQNLE